MKIGLTHTSETEVNANNTATALGSGDMEVFATPAMIALMENAAMNAVAEALPEGSSTVGTKIEATHERATGPGKKVMATARVIEVDGRRIVFEVTASDQDGIIGRGRHERFVVDREKFLSKLN